jgi:GTP-binding protein
VPVTSEDPWKNYKILLDELQQYNPELLGKPRILALSQCDITGEEQTEEIAASLRKKLRKSGVPLLCISAVTGLGLDALKDQIWQQLNSGHESQA